MSGPKFVGATNLLKPLSPKIYAFVKKPFNREEGGALSLYNEKVTNDGAIDTEAAEYVASGERKGDTNFRVNVRFRLPETAQGLSIEGVKLRRLLVEE